MIIVAGTVRIDPSTKDAWLPHARKMLEASRAEDGCHVYSFAFDVADEGLVRVYEEWESRAHLEAHFATPHMAEWRSALAEIGVISRDIKVYETEGGESV